MKRRLLAFSFLLSTALACAGEGATAPEAAEFFERTIRPLLIENCQSCHGTEKQKGGLRMDSRAALLKGGNGGAADAVFRRRVLRVEGKCFAQALRRDHWT